MVFCWQRHSGKFVVVHNGIIENYMALKEELIEKGHTFVSETDTEVVAHLMADKFDGDFESTVKKVLHIIKGSYSLVFMCEAEPDKIICTKNLLAGILQFTHNGWQILLKLPTLEF